MYHVTYFARNCAAAVVGLAMRRLTFRFSSDYRHGSTRWHRLVYAMVGTVAANWVADGAHPLSAVFWGYKLQHRFIRTQ